MRATFVSLWRVEISVHPSAAALGHAAAAAAAASLRRLAASHDVIPVVFATGASQLATLRALTAMPDIPWSRIVGFHLDEYVGIAADHPAAFRAYLRRELSAKVPFRDFHFIAAPEAAPASSGDPGGDQAAAAYGALWRRQPPLLGLIGIGENGHLAFNDPGADFADPRTVRVVELDERCRRQQVAERWFPELPAVPRRAITVTLPPLMAIPELIVSVPGERKAEAVRRTRQDPITPACPATLLRRHSGARLFLDAAAAGGAGA